MSIHLPEVTVEAATSTGVLQFPSVMIDLEVLREIRAVSELAVSGRSGCGAGKADEGRGERDREGLIGRDGHRRREGLL